MTHVRLAALAAALLVAGGARTQQVLPPPEPMVALMPQMGHSAVVTSAAYSPDGRWVVTAGGDQVALIWEAATGRVVTALAGDSTMVGSASFSPDGRRVVTASLGGTIVWDAQTGADLGRLPQPQGRPVFQSAEFGPDGRKLVTASDDKSAIAWDAATGQRVRLLAGHGDASNSAAWSPDGSKILTASADCTTGVWNAATGGRLSTLAGHADRVASAEFSPGDARVATAAMDGTARVWDAATGDVAATLVGHTGWVSSVAFAPDGARLVTASLDKTVGLWDAEGRLLGALSGHADSVSSAAFGPNGTTVATSSRDGTVRFWDAATRKETGRFGTRAPSVRFSPDGRRVVTAGESAGVWEVATGKRLATFAEKRFPLMAAFSPDGASVVTASWMVAEVWDAGTGALRRTLAGHTGTVADAAFSPDGRHLATASLDGTARVWEVATGRLVVTLIALDAGRGWLAVTPEGYYRGSAGAEGFVTWRVPGGPGEWPELVEAGRFRATLHRPDVFAHLLDAPDTDTALARADAARKQPTRPTDIARELRPRVNVLEPGQVRVGQAVTVRAKVRSGARPVERAELRVNDVPVGRPRRVQSPALGAFEEEWFGVPLSPGRNTLRATAFAADGQDDDTLHVNSEKSPVRLRVLAIGVDRYRHGPDANGYAPLRHAAGGARELAETFARHGAPLFDEVPPPRLLLDEAATREAVLDALEAFGRSMGEDDVGVVVYAGHGDRQGSRLFLTAHDTDKQRLSRTAVSAAEVRDLLAGTPGKLFLFVDACHAGAIARRDGRDGLHEDIARELRRKAAGTVIAAACKGDQVANADERGGFYTRAVVEGLPGAARDTNGVVYGRTLKAYVERRLRERTRALGAGHQQEPLFV